MQAVSAAHPQIWNFSCNFPHEYSGAHPLQRKAVVVSRRVQAGFSLLELMIVVVLIAIISALVLPGMAQANHERRVSQAAVSVLDVVREVRTRALYRGRAQTLVINAAGSALTFDAYEGSSPSCRLSNFGPGSLDPQTRVASLDLTAARYAADNVAATITLPAGTTFLQICYTPLGAAFFTTTPIYTQSQAWTNDPTSVGVGGVFQVNVFQSTGGAQRRILIPLGGMPRMRS